MITLRSKSIFHVLMLFSLLAGLCVFQPTAPALAAKSASQLPTEQLLNPDGTLNLGTGYSGKLDLSSYNVTLDSKHGPIFKPQTLATYNWKALGTTPLNGIVIPVVANGADLYAGGNFTDAGGNPDADRIAQWDGSIWSPLGKGLNNTVENIVINGTDVYASGLFTDAGGDPNADYIAKWDGTTWSALGATPLNGAVYPIVVNGTDLYVGGYFTDAGGDPNADHIAKWDGTAWSAVGGGVSSQVFDIAFNSVDMYVVGTFTDAGGVANADNIAKFDGSSWSDVGGGLNAQVSTIDISSAGIYVGGLFTDAGGDLNADHIAKLSGGSWVALGTGLNNTVGNIVINGTDVYAAGIFTDAGGDVNADYIAKWDGTTWSALATTPLNSFVTGFAFSGANIYVGGLFGDAGGDPNADFIAKLGPDVTKLTFHSAGSLDGWVLESSETSKIGGTLNATTKTFKVGDEATNGQYRGVLSFKTGAALPDTAIITNVTLKLKKSKVVGGGNPVKIFHGFMVGIKKGAFGNMKLEDSDFQAKANKTFGPFKPVLVNGWYSINLTSAQTYINKLTGAGGLTQIKLRFKLDDNNNEVANYITLFGGEATAAIQPQLIIEYYVP